MLRKTLLPTFNSVATGQTATVDLPLGRRYHTIWLEFSDTGGASNGNAANLAASLANFATDIRVKLNGHTQRLHTAVQLNEVNSVNGAEFGARASGTAGNANYRLRLPIYLGEPWRENTGEKALPSWNVDGGQASFQIEVDLKAGLTGVNITGFYTWEPLTAKLGAIAKMFRQTYAALGTQNDFNLKERDGFLQAIHLFPTSDGKYVNKVKLTADGADVQDLIDTGENAAVLAAGGMNPDTSATPRFDLVVDFDDPINSALRLSGLNSLTLQTQYNASATGSLPAIFIIAGNPE
jgi:hypothetical protein